MKLTAGIVVLAALSVAAPIGAQWLNQITNASRAGDPHAVG